MTRGAIDRDMLIAFALGKLSRDDSLDVLAAVERDPFLSNQLEEVLLLVRGIVEAAEDGGSNGRSAHEPAVGYLLRAAAVVIILLGSVIVASKLTTDRYHDLARLGENDYSLSLRGELDNGVEWARNAFLAGDRDDAIGQLERIINSHSEGDKVDGVHWMVGAMILAGSERGFVGLFPFYDEKSVDRGMAHLAISARSANPQIAEESHWLRMKGFLMLSQPDSAIREGKAVVRFDGGLKERSESILKRIR